MENLRQERDSLRHECDRLRCERDAVQLERDTLLSEKSNLQAELNNRNDIIQHLQDHVVSNVTFKLSVYIKHGANLVPRSYRLTVTEILLA